MPAEHDNAERLLHSPLTDSGNGERLVALHGHDMRFLSHAKRWLCWDGARWVDDRTRQVRRFAKQTARAMYLETQKLKPNTAEEEQRRDMLLKHARSMESDAKLEAMIRCAADAVGMTITNEQLDSHPMLFNVRNGVVDLTSGELGPHDRDLLMTKLAPVSYDRAAKCPRWERFMLEVFGGDAALVGYVQRAVGYALTADTREQCFHLLYGTGSNGKSTFVETIASLVGDYGMESDFSAFIEQRNSGGARNDLARLAGARYVRASESGEGKKLDEAVIQKLTGSETISARFLYEEAFQFEPTFKIWLSANHKPVIRSTVFAIWRRLRTVPFLVQFEGDKKEDAEHLKSTLRAELPGILNWAIQGCLLWLEQGLNPPESVLAANLEYRTESDTLGVFLDEVCELRDSYEVKATDLYLAYKRWAEEGGEHPAGQTSFGRRLKERGFEVRKSNGAKYRMGLRLRGEHQPSDNRLF